MRPTKSDITSDPPLDLARRERLALGRVPSEPVLSGARLDDVYKWAQAEGKQWVLDLFNDPHCADQGMVRQFEEGNRAAYYGVKFGLTPTEAEVAAAFATGKSLEGIAQGRGVSINTIRTHFSRLRDKLGVHSQAQMLRVLLVEDAKRDAL